MDRSSGAVLLHPPESSPVSRPEPISIRPQIAPKPAARFAFIDGLRGLAALCIVVFHIWWYEPEPFPTFESAHWIVDAALLRVRGGVQILLVVSGFLIAYTLRKTWVSPKEIATFIGRRLIRLVPAYWVAIGACILVDGICRKMLGEVGPFEGPISFSRISAHMTFLQDVLGHDPLGAGMWTLCIEMQFYFVAIVSWGLAQQLFLRPNESQPRPSTLGLLLVFAPVSLMSLFYWRSDETTNQWVIHFLWMFFLGMSTWWALDKTISARTFGVIIGLALLDQVFDAEWRSQNVASLMELLNIGFQPEEQQSWRYENAVAMLTALAIYIAGTKDQLHVWLNWRWLQHLGRISYSLYLIHFPVCHLLTTVGWKWCGNNPTSIQALLILASSFVVSLAAGQLLYTYVEAPSAKWAASTKTQVA